LRFADESAAEQAALREALEAVVSAHA